MKTFKIEADAIYGLRLVLGFSENAVIEANVDENSYPIVGAELATLEQGEVFGAIVAESCAFKLISEYGLNKSASDDHAAVKHFESLNILSQ